jgi:hypothetical protein
MRGSEADLTGNININIRNINNLILILIIIINSNDVIVVDVADDSSGRVARGRI